MAGSLLVSSVYTAEDKVDWHRRYVTTPLRLSLAILITLPLMSVAGKANVVVRGEDLSANLDAQISERRSPLQKWQTSIFNSSSRQLSDHGLMVVTAPARTSSRRQGNGNGNGNGSPLSVESYHPAPDAQTYRDLLIFEERLKQNAARLIKRKKKYQSESKQGDKGFQHQI